MYAALHVKYLHFILVYPRYTSEKLDCQNATARLGRLVFEVSKVMLFIIRTLGVRRSVVLPINTVSNPTTYSTIKQLPQIIHRTN